MVMGTAGCMAALFAGRCGDGSGCTVWRRQFGTADGADKGKK